MEKAKCVNENCGKILVPEDRIWQIRIVHGDGLVTYDPCCCDDCARTVQEKYAGLHRGRYENMLHQSFQIMPLKMF